MKSSEAKIGAVVAGVLIVGAADIVVHRGKIQQSMRGQEHHYTTKHRGPLSRFGHALASQTFTGKMTSWVAGQVVPALESEG